MGFMVLFFTVVNLNLKQQSNQICKLLGFLMSNMSSVLEQIHEKLCGNVSEDEVSSSVSNLNHKKEKGHQTGSRKPTVKLARW